MEKYQTWGATGFLGAREFANVSLNKHIEIITIYQSTRRKVNSAKIVRCLPTEKNSQYMRTKNGDTIIVNNQSNLQSIEHAVD